MDNNVVAKHILDIAVGLEKKSKNELIVELSDIFDNASKIDLNSKENIAGLKSLAKAFEAIFDKAGNKTINFADLIEMPPDSMFAEMGKIAATSFWDAWNSVAGGASDSLTSSLKESLKQLRLKQTDLKKEQVRIQLEIDKKVSNKKDFEDLLDFDGETVHAAEIDGDVLEEAKKQYNDFLKIGRELKKIQKEHGVNSKEYVKALYDAEGAMHELYRMRKILKKLETPIPTNLKAAYGLLDPYTEQPKYEQKMEEAGKSPTLPFYETNTGNFIGDSWERYVQSIRRSQKQLVDIENQISAIDAKIVDITKSIQASGDTVDDAINNTQDGLKTLNELEKAYQTILTTDQNRPKRPDKKKSKNLLDAIEYTPKDNVGIKSLYTQYLDAASSGDWVEEYKALLKFIRTYEQFSKDGKKHSSMNVPEIQKLFEQTKHMEKNITNMLQSVYNMAHNLPPVGLGGADIPDAKIISDEVVGAEQVADAKQIAAEKEAEARREAELKAEAEQKQAQAEKEKAEALKQQRIEQEKLTQAAEKERLAKEQTLKIVGEMVATLQQVTQFSGQQDKEHMTLIGADAKSNTVGGEDFAVSAETLVNQLIDNVKNQILMFLHNHPDDMLAFTPSDIATYGKLYKAQGIDVHGILAEGIIQTIDFTGIAKETILQVAQSYSDNLSAAAQDSNGLLIYKDGELSVSEELQEMANESPESYARIKEVLQNKINEALTKALTDNGLESTVKTFDLNSLPQLAEYLLQIKQNAQAAINPVEKLNILTSLKEQNNAKKIQQEADARRDNAEAINQEVQATENLNSASEETAQSSLIDKYNQAPDEVKRKYQELAALQSEIDNIERKAQKTSIDIDPWNATNEQKDQIVAAWREYQKVIQEIKDMPIVETEDDEKRLLELKAKAVSLYETMYQGHLNDVTGDGYASEYGLSAEEGRQMHIDMQDTPRKDLDKSLDVLKNKLYAVYTEAQNLDTEMFNMAASLSHEDADNFFEHVRQDALAAKSAIEAVNDSVEETKNAAQDSGGTGTGDASSAELENLRNQLEAKDAEVAEANRKREEAEIAERAAQDSAAAERHATEVAQDENLRLQAELNETNQQLIAAQDAKIATDQQVSKLTEESTVKDGIIKDLREQLANVKTGVSEEQASINTEELRTLLNSIVYNVKIAHDDNDKTANKIALDETALEGTLNRVFTNILNPQVDQPQTTETTGEPWAREETLSGTIQQLLSSIQDNTAKFDKDTTHSTATISGVESTLITISKTLLEINSKTTRGYNKHAKQPDKPSQPSNRFATENNNTATKTEAKKLIADYEKLGRLRAKFENDGDIEVKAQLQVLAQEVKRKKESLQVTSDEILELRKKSNIAYESEKKILDAAKQKKKIDDQQKKIAEEAANAEKDAKKAEKKRLADSKKLAKRQAMAGKAGNAIGRAENTWLGAENLDQSQIPEQFKKDIEEYYDAIDKLRLKHHEINTSEVVTEQQQNELIAQTRHVNKLTEQLSPLIAQYERLSGDNTQVLGVSNLGDNATLEEYERGLRQAVMTATNGKAQIKGFDYETKTLTYTLKTGKNQFTEYTAEVRQLDHQFTATAGKTKKMETFLEATTRKMKELTSYFSGMAVFNFAKRELSRGIRYVREIDSALTELKKVTDETEETYDKFLDTAAKTADKVGSTIQKVVSSTADWARLNI